MKKTINVTKRDIEKWVNRTHDALRPVAPPTSCAIFKAVKRVLPVKSVAIFTFRLLTGVSIILPNFVSENINRMDSGIVVPPFKFTVEVPDDRL